MVHPAIPPERVKRLWKPPQAGQPQTLTSQTNARGGLSKSTIPRPKVPIRTHLKTLADTFHKETRTEREAGGRSQPDRIDFWGMPFAVDASEEQRIAKCKSHILAEIAAREAFGKDDFRVSKLRGHYAWNRAIFIMDQTEESWNKDEGGFLAVYWDLHSDSLEMRAQEYGDNNQTPETSAIRYTRDDLDKLLMTLRSFF